MNALVSAGHVPSNGIGENGKGLCQVNTEGGVELPVEAFPIKITLFTLK